MLKEVMAMRRIQVEAEFEIKQVPSVEAIQLDYSDQLTVHDSDTLDDLIRRIKDRIRKHAQAYGGQLTRIREIQILITNP